MGPLGQQIYDSTKITLSARQCTEIIKGENKV